MEKNKVKKLVSIVSSKMGGDISILKKTGENWYNYFVDNRMLVKGNNILEYGAGLGRLSIPFNRLGNVTAIDGNLEMVEFLRENGIRAYLAEDCKPILNERFDFAISTFVLQHLHFPHAQNVVKQISEVTDVFYFTYPIIEDGGVDSYIYYKDSCTVNVLESHKISRKMHLDELPILFETSSFKSKKISRVFSNLFKIEK